MLNQLSLLFLYRRAFTLIEPWFKYVLYAIGVFCIASGIALFFAGLFHCIPFNHGWNPNVPGHCSIDIQPLYVTATVLNLAGDIGIVAAPIPLIWSIQMSLSTKFAVTGLFLLGGLWVLISSAECGRLTNYCGQRFHHQHNKASYYYYRTNRRFHM